MGLDTLPAEILQHVLGLVFRRNWLTSPNIRSKLDLRLVCKNVDQNIRHLVFGRLDCSSSTCMTGSDMNEQMATRLLFEIVRAGVNETILVAVIRRAAQVAQRLAMGKILDDNMDNNMLSEKYDHILCSVVVSNLGSFHAVQQLLSADCPNNVSESEDYAGALAAAAYDDDSSLMRRILHDSPEMNSGTFYFATALHWAAHRGHIEPVNLLLEKGAQITGRDWWNRTPLHLAASQGHSSVVRCLLDTNVRENEIRDEEFCLLFSTSEKAHDEAKPHSEPAKAVEAEAINEDAKDKMDRTPLSLASEGGHDGVVKLLLERDDVNAGSKTRHGWTPLLWAVKGGHVQVVKQLLTSPRVAPQAPESMGMTALLLAAKKGHYTIFKLLLDRKKVKADAKCKLGRGPLSWAAEAGAEDIVEYLLTRGDVDVDSKDIMGRTPLYHAMDGGREQVVKLLLAQDGVDANPIDKFDNTPNPSV